MMIRQAIPGGAFSKTAEYNFLIHVRERVYTTGFWKSNTFEPDGYNYGESPLLTATKVVYENLSE